MLLINPQILDELSTHVRQYDDAADGELLRRLRLLDEPSRVLLEMAMKHNLTRRQIACLLKITPGNVTRRLRRIVQRLHDPLVIALADRTCTLPPDYRELGIEHFLQRLSIPALAKRHQLSRRDVTRILEHIRGWHRGVSTRK